MPDARPHVMAATALEAWATRLTLGAVPVTRTGVALRRARAPQDGAVALLCGVAGALSQDLQPGSVIVPQAVGLPRGPLVQCHTGWVEALLGAAKQLGYEADSHPLLTAPSFVTGPARAHWADQGYWAVDMETGALAARGWQVATVRVILDSPAHSIAEDWERPIRALIRPTLWGELLWLARAAPCYSLRAARILKQALPGGS